MFYNNLVFISLSVCILIYNSSKSEYGFSFWSRKHLENISWWYIVPGFMGAVIVGGSAVAFSKLGANKSIVLLVCSQIIFSLVWESFFEDKTIKANNIIGGVVILVGLLISLYGNKLKL